MENQNPDSLLSWFQCFLSGKHAMTSPLSVSPQKEKKGLICEQKLSQDPHGSDCFENSLNSSHELIFLQTEWIPGPLCFWPSQCNQPFSNSDSRSTQTFHEPLRTQFSARAHSVGDILNFLMISQDNSTIPNQSGLSHAKFILQVPWNCYVRSLMRGIWCPPGTFRFSFQRTISSSKYERSDLQLRQMSCVSWSLFSLALKMAAALSCCWRHRKLVSSLNKTKPQSTRSLKVLTLTHFKCTRSTHQSSTSRMFFPSTLSHEDVFLYLSALNLILPCPCRLGVLLQSPLQQNRWVLFKTKLLSNSCSVPPLYSQAPAQQCTHSFLQRFSRVLFGKTGNVALTRTCTRKHKPVLTLNQPQRCVQSSANTAFLSVCPVSCVIIFRADGWSRWRFSLIGWTGAFVWTTELLGGDRPCSWVKMLKSKDMSCWTSVSSLAIGLVPQKKRNQTKKFPESTNSLFLSTEYITASLEANPLWSKALEEQPQLMTNYFYRCQIPQSRFPRGKISLISVTFWLPAAKIKIRPISTGTGFLPPLKRNDVLRKRAEISGLRNQGK